MKKLWLIPAALLILAIALAISCSEAAPASVSEPTPTPTQAPTPAPTSSPTLAPTVTPTLELPPMARVQLGLAIGDTAIDFKLKDLNGTEVTLFGLLTGKPVVLEFGSYT